MKKIFLYCFLLIFFVSKETIGLKNNIVVKIENKIITNFEIKNKILGTLILNNKEINQNNIDLLKKQSLDFLILLKLKKLELSKYEIESNNSEIQNYINNMSNINFSDLKKRFESNGLDFDLFFDEVKTQLKWQKLIYKIYSDKIKFDKSAIKKEVDNLIKNQKEIVQYRISEIEILSENNKENNNLKISNIKNLILTQGFEETASKYSISNSADNNGDIGWINASSLTKDIYNSVSKLEIGQITEAIIKQDSILFLKLVDKKSIKPKQLDRSQLENNLVNKKTNELFNLYSKSHLSKLKNTSFIEYK